MSINPNSAPSDNTLPAPDYKDLRKDLLQHIEAFSRESWTDYNTHDPGITVGEHLCFGLTEAIHTTRLPIADLLRSEDPSAPNTEYAPESILPCGPVTLHDYRKLLIDEPGVRNAWLQPTFDSDCTLYYDAKRLKLSQKPIPNQPIQRVTPRGFYNVTVEFEENIPKAEYPKRLKKIRSLLETNRNLCEVFLDIYVVPIDDIGLCIDIEVTNTTRIDEIMAQVVHEMERFIAPPVKFYTYQERIDAGHLPEEIFNGPLLRHGFLDNAEIEASEPRAFLRASDLIQVLMDIPGIQAIRRLLMTRYVSGAPVSSGVDWSLPLDIARAARFSIEHSRIHFYKKNIPYIPQRTEFIDALEDLRSADRFTRQSDGLAFPSPPEGTLRKLGNFQTLQNEFPQNYGIGRVGLPRSATALRKAQALQLKAYILIQETLLSGFAYQAAQMRALFSLLPDTPGLNAKLPEGIHHFEKLTGSSEADFNTNLQDVTETPDEAASRRNKILDHLLSRFAETFEEYSLVAGRVYGNSAQINLIRDKIEWLKHYPELSSQRFRAFNRQSKTWPVWNISGLEKRLKVLLGAMRVIEAAAEYYSEEDDDDIEEIRFRIRGPDSQVILSSSTRYPSESAAREEVCNVAIFAAVESNYAIRKTSNNKHHIVLMDDNSEVIARRIYYYDTKEEAHDALRSMVGFFTSSLNQEPVYLVEHILLRPGTALQELLPVCDTPHDPNDPPHSKDPYSFRITILLPAWTERFRNVFFRHFMERFVREETPAHIYPKICWLSEQQMDQFEKVYFPWRAGLADSEADLDTLLTRLILVWKGLRSQFPQATLHGCVSAEEDNPVVLDNSTLGTLIPPSDPS